MSVSFKLLDFFVILIYDKIINIFDNDLRIFKNYFLWSVFLDDFEYVYDVFWLYCFICKLFIFVYFLLYKDIFYFFLYLGLEFLIVG